MSIYIAALVVVVGLMLCVFVYFRQRAKRYREHCIAQAIDAWSNAQGTLFQLAREGKINAHSDTFGQLFQLQSVVLNHPHDLEIVADELEATLFTLPKDELPEWMYEIVNWPQEMASVFRNMAVGTRMLLAGYPGLSAILTRGLLRRDADRTREITDGLTRRIHVEPVRTFDATLNLAEASHRLEQLARRASGPVSGGNGETPLSLVG